MSILTSRTVDAVLATAKLLISDVMPQLPGLDDQQPESSLLPLLRDTLGGADAAIQADYEPPGDLCSIIRLADTSMDLVFGGKRNDLVVPTDGVSNWTGGNFPSSRLLAFSEETGVFHSHLFRQPETRSQMLTWLD